jgi:hypothetical protein
MPDLRHQTVRLARGRHRRPEEGVCAMELSSLLGGERFTDRPQRVCPVVAAFLRGYNDAVDPVLRQELYALAAIVVDSRSDDAALRRERTRSLLQWAVDVWAAKRTRLPWPPAFEPANGFAELEQAGGYVGRAARRDRRVHERTVAFVDRLVSASRSEAEPGGSGHGDHAVARGERIGEVLEAPQRREAARR